MVRFHHQHFTLQLSAQWNVYLFFFLLLLHSVSFVIFLLPSIFLSSFFLSTSISFFLFLLVSPPFSISFSLFYLSLFLFSFCISLSNILSFSSSFLSLQVLFAFISFFSLIVSATLSFFLSSPSLCFFLTPSLFLFLFLLSLFLSCGTCPLSAPPPVCMPGGASVTGSDSYSFSPPPVAPQLVLVSQ